MKITNLHPVQSLALDHLAINQKLARCLPPALAFRHHALPVAKDNDHITVAMADPDDQTARQAIETALETELYVVQGDRGAIDELLAEIWPEADQSALRLLVYRPATPRADEVQAYAQYLTDLLGGQLSRLEPENGTEVDLADLIEAASGGPELVIFGEPDQSLLERLLSGPTSCKAVERTPTSILMARRPRWPLKRILLVSRGQASDQAAVDWVVRMAQPARAAVTVLAVLPPMSPAMHSQALARYGLSYWLTTDTPLGWQLRQIAGQLVDWEIEGKLRFRQGSPDSQIQNEIAEGDHDLIVIAADSTSWWERRLLGKLVSPLLRWVDRPVLIAKCDR